MKIALVLILALVLISCQQKESEKPLDEKSFVISNTWMRPGSMNRNTAAFMKITNNMDVDDTLYAASSDLAKVVEIHETYKKENDMMGMRHVDYLVIPSNSVVELKPGSFHIMFIGLNKDLAIDQISKIKLFFRVNGEVEIDVKVQQTKM
jgi:copper(I)-binding protein